MPEIHNHKLNHLERQIYWLNENKIAKKILCNLKTPMTGRQLSQILKIDLNVCGHILRSFRKRGLAYCCNPQAKISRLYYLTLDGKVCLSKFSDSGNSNFVSENIYDFDWETFGWVCFSRRASILKVLNEPMNSPTIRRRILSNNYTSSIGEGNIRDVIREFLKKGIVKKVWIRKRVHPRYELTDLGKKLQSLLMRSGAVYFTFSFSSEYVFLLI